MRPSRLDAISRFFANRRLSRRAAVARGAGLATAVAVATTFAEEALGGQGACRNATQSVVTRIGQALLPEDPPLLR